MAVIGAASISARDGAASTWALGDPLRGSERRDWPSSAARRGLGQRRGAGGRVGRITDERARFLPEIKSTCARVARLVSQAEERGFLPLVLGGDHSVALGTLGGLARGPGPEASSGSTRTAI